MSEKKSESGKKIERVPKPAESKAERLERLRQEDSAGKGRSDPESNPAK